MITNKTRNGWREKLRDLLEVTIEQCEEIEEETDKAINSLPYTIDGDGDYRWVDEETHQTAKALGRDQGHAMNLKALVENIESNLDDLFTGSTRAYDPFPDDQW